MIHGKAHTILRLSFGIEMTGLLNNGSLYQSHLISLDRIA